MAIKKDEIATVSNSTVDANDLVWFLRRFPGYARVWFPMFMQAAIQYVLQILHTPEDIDDMAQQLWLNLLSGKGGNTFIASSSPEEQKFYVRGSMKNICLKELARRKHRPVVSISVIELMPHTGDTPEEACRKRELLRTVGKYLDCLTDRQREVYVLREVRGMSHRAIAVKLGIKHHSQVRTIELRAKARIEEFKADDDATDNSL